MKTFHEWLSEQRRMREGLWLGDDKLAQPGMSNVNPLDQPKAREREAQAYGIGGENAQGEADGENAKVNARRHRMR